MEFNHMALMHGPEQRTKETIDEQQTNPRFTKSQKLIAAIATVAALGGGAMFARGGEGAPSPEPTQEATEDINPAPSENGSPNETPSVAESGAEQENESFSVTRANGEIIHLNPVTSDDPEKMFQGFIELLSCYITTGDEKCANYFSGDDNVFSAFEWQRGLIEESLPFDDETVFLYRVDEKTSLRHEEREDGSIIIEFDNLYTVIASTDEMFNDNSDVFYTAEEERNKGYMIITDMGSNKIVSSFEIVEQ